MNDPQTISESRLVAWYDYLNEILGVFCFTAALTALQVGSYSAEVATFTLIFIVLLSGSISSKNEVQKHHERVERYIGSYRVTLLALLKAPVFLIGMGTLVGVAAGVDLSVIEGLSLKSLLLRV
ncbi:hypothetical protein [Vibrio cholerae]|uniref:hypothetical protein n=1 Tax=Vibrio cholerae TaxID=666 RepID=UPI002934E497|nr:hypothetical protein [Vibrio cholerae]MDV2347932.1 hypothetical protein [Vibrio cholerae]